jgi:hypothetical protein
MHFLVPNFDSVVNPSERREPSVIYACYRNSVGYQQQKLWVIGQVIDERLAARSAVDPPVTKNLL